MGFLTSATCKNCDTNHIPLATAQSPLTARLSFGRAWTDEDSEKNANSTQFCFVVLKEIRHQNSNFRLSLARISVDHDQMLKPDHLQIKSNVENCTGRMIFNFGWKDFFWAICFQKSSFAVFSVLWTNHQQLALENLKIRPKLQALKLVKSHFSYSCTISAHSQCLMRNEQNKYANIMYFQEF